MNMIDISHVTCDYGDGKGIFDISFSIKKGEIFGFLGPNGAGKTTTIRHLLGFLYASQGTCSIQGMDCGKQAADIQKNLGYIPGEIALMNDVTGTQFIRFMAEYRGMHDIRRAEALMKRFELDPKGKIKRMSKGMKQKIGIVTAFMHDPDVLILDEPTSGLDPLMQNTFVDLILEEKKRGKTILMSSHMFEEVEKTCDRVGIIKDGHMVKVSTIEALRSSKQQIYRIGFAKQEDAVKFCKEGFTIRHAHEKDVEVMIGNDINALIHHLGQYHVERLDVVHQSLEEIFMQFYGGEHHV